MEMQDEQVHTEQQKLLGGSCFIPAGTWAKNQIPVYNPSDSFRTLRVLVTMSANQLSLNDIRVAPKSFITFDGHQAYVVVDEFA